MVGKSSFTLFLIFFFSNFLENFASKQQKQPSICQMLSSKPVPYPTLSPTKVNTKEAQMVYTSSPVADQNSLFPLTKIINTGRALTLQGNPPPTSTSVHGGVLCNRTYIFHSAEFYQTKNLTGRSYIEVNGKGTPLTVIQTYFNKQYGTYENALKNRDGLVIEVLPITFTSADNPIFYPIEFIIKLLRKPGSYIYIPAIFSFAWYGMKLPFDLTYYSFYGSHINLATGNQDQSAIILLPDRPVEALSKFQFEKSFLELLDNSGQVLDNAPPLQDFGQRDLYKSHGFVNLWY